MLDYNNNIKVKSSSYKLLTQPPLTSEYNMLSLIYTMGEIGDIKATDLCNHGNIFRAGSPCLNWRCWADS